MKIYFTNLCGSKLKSRKINGGSSVTAEKILLLDIIFTLTLFLSSLLHNKIVNFKIRQN